MKKILNRLRKKQVEEASSRITNETIAEHRERILAGGRRFKYPLQYARHRLVFNAIIIGVSALLLLVVLIWSQLYWVQNTSDFMYRVTKIIPLPVASIDGQPVLYSDYLMKYRSSIHYLEDKEQLSLKTDDGKEQAAHVKELAMQDAVADAYALKLAKELDLTISASELELFLKLQRVSSDGEVSQQTYDAVILDYYGWSADEYRHATHNKLLRQKVTYAIDAPAKESAEALGNLVKAGGTDLETITKQLNETATVPVEFGTLEQVPKTNQDGGLAVAAAKLSVGQVSDVIQSTTGDGYYIIKLTSSNDTQVSYQYVHVPLTIFQAKLTDVVTRGLVKEHITVPKASEIETVKE